MEEVKNTQTKTMVQEKTETNQESDVKALMGEGKHNLSAPLFLMFAEYLGYVGKVLQWVDQWCAEKKKPEDWQVKFIETEAIVAFNECKKKFSVEKMRELYDGLYEVILFLYDENLKAMESPTED